MPSIAVADTSVGEFEIDGNTPDSPSGEPTDWSAVLAPTATNPSPPIVNNHFDDEFGQGKEDAFGGMSKNEGPGTWDCDDESTPAKDDIKDGNIAFRTIGEDQFVYVNFTRVGTNGSADLDYEFNQGSGLHPSASCQPFLPARLPGDLLIAFDSPGGTGANVNLFRWTGTASSGTFVPVTNAPLIFQGQMSADRSFGEAALNLSAALGGPITCGEFSSAYMKSRASVEINSDLKDRTASQPVTLGLCPTSEIDKTVRNITTGGETGAFADTATASPGDVLEYKIVYTNSGAAPATDVTVTDTIQTGQTLNPNSCSTTPGPVSCAEGTTSLTWNLGTVSNVAPDNTRTMTFRVTLTGPFSAGDTSVKNVSSVTTAEEDEPTTDETTVTVNAAAILTAVKTANPTTTVPGGMVEYTIVVTNSGNAPGTLTFQDDYDDRITDISAVTSDPPGGTCTQGTVNGTAGFNCTTSSINGNNATQTFTYTARMPQTFTTTPGETPCSSTQQRVRNVIVGGDDATVCVDVEATFTVVKTADPTTTVPGGTVTYTIVVTNTGNTPGSTSFQDDYDDRITDISAVTSDPPGGTCTPGTVEGTAGFNCQSSVLDPDDEQTFTYTAKMPMTFTTSPGETPCSSTQQRVRNVIVGGDDASVCVDITLTFRVVKTADPTTTVPGGTVTYTIVVTNTGNSPGSTSFQDDYDDRITDISAVTSNPPGGTCTQGTVNGTAGFNCESSVLDPGDDQTFTYTAKMPTSFSTPPGGFDCEATEHPVRNVIVGGDDAVVCVNAPAILNISKTACPSPAVPGGVLTYTITFSNTGQTAATGVTVTDTWPEGTPITVVSTGGGTQNGNTITWGPSNIGTLDPGETNTRTVQVLVDASNGATLQDTATITATGVTSATTGVVSVPVSNAGAVTHGTAYGADANVLGLALIEELARVDTTAPPSPQHAEDEVPPLSIPGTVTLELVNTTSDSSVANEAETTSTAQTLGVNLLSGAITADVVRGVSTSTADANFATSSSAGSTFANLRINGNSILNVAPNTTVDVKNPLLPTQTVARAVLYEETKSATFVPGANGTPGKFTSTHSVNMIHVTLLKPFLTLPKGAEIIVSHANTDATYPSGLACGTRPGLVSGNAFNAWINGTLPAGQQFANVQVGDAEITPLGGDDTDGIAANIPGVVTNHTVTNEAHGTIAGHPSAWARSRAEGVNVLDGLVTADVLDVRATSTTTANSATTAFTTTFANVRIGDLPPLSISTSPNSTYVVDLPTGGFAVIVINEQILSNGTKDTFGTINALHVFLYSGQGILTAEIIVGHAHSDAHHA